jgi:hypothetical protein
LLLAKVPKPHSRRIVICNGWQYNLVYVVRGATAREMKNEKALGVCEESGFADKENEWA